MKQPFPFNGKLDLSDPSGIIYEPYTQTQALTIKVGNRLLSGWALVPIKANGTTITLPSNFVKYGGDDIVNTLNTTNHLQFWYYSENTIYYTNKTV